MVTHYTQRATAGLLIGEASTPNAVGHATEHHRDPHRPARGRVAAGHRGAGGGRAHVPAAPARWWLSSGDHRPDPGRALPVPLPETIFTPRGHRPAVVPREMTRGDIRATAADFAGRPPRRRGGLRGRRGAPWRRVLLHQFLAGNTNRRTDGYGGPLGHGCGSRRRSPRRWPTRSVPTGWACGSPREHRRTGCAGREDDTEALYSALLARLKDLDLAYLHLVHADPDTTVYR